MMLPFTRVLATLLLLVGCSSRDPRLCTLEFRPGPINDASPGIVTVRSFGLPRYLERSEIMQASGPGRLVASDDDWWAEPLRVMLRRVAVGDLAQRLPNSTVLEGGGTIGAHSDAEIEFDLQRFERDGSGQVVMLGNFAIQRGGTRTIERLRLIVPVAGPSIRDQVNAMSTALGQAVDLTATRLAQ